MPQPLLEILTGIKEEGMKTGKLQMILMILKIVWIRIQRKRLKGTEKKIIILSQVKKREVLNAFNEHDFCTLKVPTFIHKISFLGRFFWGEL